MDNKIVVILLCIFISPLAVYLKTKDTKATLINLALYLLTCGIGGLIHGLMVCLK